MGKHEVWSHVGRGVMREHGKDTGRHGKDMGRTRKHRKSVFCGDTGDRGRTWEEHGKNMGKQKERVHVWGDVGTWEGHGETRKERVCVWGVGKCGVMWGGMGKA